YGVFIAQPLIQLTEIHRGRAGMIFDDEYETRPERTGENPPGGRRAFGLRGADHERAVFRKMEIAGSGDAAQASRQLFDASAGGFVTGFAAQPDSRRLRKRRLRERDSGQ